MPQSLSVQAIFSADPSKFNASVQSMIGQLGNLERASNLNAKGARQAIAGVGDGVSGVGSAITLGVTAPLLGVGAAAAKTNKEFSGQMNRVSAISGATGDDFNKLKKQAIDLGAASVFTAKQVAESQENLASAGFSTNEILAATPGIMDLASVAGGDMALASESAATAIRQFGLDVSKSGHVADVYAQTASSTNAETQDLAEAMKYAGPMAHTLGISLEETAAAIGIMSNAGIKGSQAGTSLRGALTRLAKPSKQASDAMEAIGFSAFDSNGKLKPFAQIIGELKEKTRNLTQEQKTQAFAAIFGQNALSGMLAVVDAGPDQISGLTNALINSNGAAKKAADTINSGMPGALVRLSSAIDGAKIAIGDSLAPEITKVADLITELVTKFNELSPQQQSQIVKWLGIAAAIGPVLFVTGKIIKLLSPLGGLLSMVTGGLGGVLGKLSPMSGTLQAAGGSAATTGSQFAGMGVAFAGAGAGIFLAAKGMDQISLAATRLAQAGPLAIGVATGMAGAIGLLMLEMAKLGPQLSIGAAGMVAFGAALAACGFAMQEMSKAAVQVAAGGPKTIAIFVEMQVAVGALAAVFAALGPALTAGSAGMMAFGGMLVMAGGAANLAATAIVKISDVLPILAKHGTSGAKSIAAIGAAMVAFGGGATVAGAASLALAAGMTALGAAMAIVAPTSAASAAGLKTITGIAPTLTIALSKSAGAIGTATVKITGLGAASLASVAGITAVTGVLVALGGSATVAAGGITLSSAATTALAGGMGLLLAATKGVNATIKSIAGSTQSAANNLKTMEGTVNVVKTGVAGLGDTVKGAFKSFADALGGTEGKVKASTQNISGALNNFSAASSKAGISAGQSFSNGMVKELQAGQAGVNKTMVGIIGTLNSAANGARNSGVNIGNSFAAGMESTLARARAAAAQLAATADQAIKAKAQIGSPSKVQTKNGQYWAAGFINGIKNMFAEARRTTETLGSYSPAIPQFGRERNYGSLDQLGGGINGVFNGRNNNANITLVLGEHEYRVQVDDLTKSQKAQLRLANQYR